MEKEYVDLRVCRCGAILITRGIDEEISNHKEVAVICGHCGRIHIVGSEHTWIDEKHGVATIYHREEQESFRDKQTILDTTKYAKIIYNEGIKIPLMNGEYARYYTNGAGFQSYDRILDYDIFGKMRMECKTYQQVCEEWNEQGKQVNMSLLISENSEEDMEVLSHYFISGLDWKGTKFEKKWSRIS